MNRKLHVSLIPILLATAIAGCDQGGGNVGAQAPQAAGTAASEAPQANTPPQPGVRAKRRLDATADVVGATILRVDPAAAAIPGPRMAGYLVRSGTERPPDAAVLKELLSLTQTASGFDDTIQKRCVPGASVGVRLFRKGGAAERRTELVFDFGCNRLLIAEEGSSDAFDSFFDPSRAAFLAVLKRAFPKDSDLAGLG